MLTSKHILLIEDDPVLGPLLKRILTNVGCIVTLAQNGAQGIKLLEASSFDLIITDIHMPECDGFTVLSTVITRRYALPVILMTGRNTMLDVKAALQAGAAACLFKPFCIDDFLAQIASCCQHPPTSTEENP